MDFRARSPKTTPKYPLHRGQIRAIFRAIKPLSYFSGKARRLFYPIYDNASRKRSALNMGPELPKNLTWQKLKEFPTNGFPGLWVSKYSAQTAKRLYQFVVRLVEGFLQAVEKVRNASRAQDERRSVNDYQSRSVRFSTALYI
jgi:hypothetical protein